MSDVIEETINADGSKTLTFISYLDPNDPRKPLTVGSEIITLPDSKDIQSQIELAHHVLIQGIDATSDTYDYAEWNVILACKDALKELFPESITCPTITAGILDHRGFNKSVGMENSIKDMYGYCIEISGYGKFMVALWENGDYRYYVEKGPNHEAGSGPHAMDDNKQFLQEYLTILFKRTFNRK